MHTLRPLFPYLRQHRRIMMAGLVLATIGAGTGTVPPYLLRRAVDDLNTRGVDMTRLLQFGLMIVGIAIVDSVVKFGQRWWIGLGSYRVEYALRRDFFAQLLRLDQKFYGQNYTGDLMARATNDLSAVRMMLGPGLTNIAGSGLMIIFSCAWMLAIDIPLALVTLLLLPLISLSFVVIGQRMRERFTAVQDQFGRLSTRAQENFSGIRTIKAYAQEDAEIASFVEVNKEYQRLNLRYVLLSGLMWPMMSLLLGATLAVVLLVGGQGVASGRLTLGELVQFIAYLGLLGWPVIALGWTVTLYQQGLASMGRIDTVLSYQPQIRDPQMPVTVEHLDGDVRFDNVGVKYGDTWVVRHVSFHVPAGGSLAIVGATGAGKTTLVNLLGRINDPTEGHVLLDGHDLRHLTLETLRRNIGFVPQDTFLFSVPLRENVQFGRETVTDEEFDNALVVSQMVNDLPQFPQGMDTVLGERGVTLSGGQKQRTAIARAILRDAPVLVLDDALSSVDTHTAAEILGHLRRVMEGRTTIIIAQRIATVKDADEIVVLDGGKIVERGTHTELVKQDSRYAAMYRRELLRQEMDE